MIVAISGKSKSGKDFSAKIIQEYVKKDWKIVKFADKVKDIVCILLNCTREDLEREDFKEQELPLKWWVWVNKETNEIIPYYQATSLKDCFLRKTTPRILMQIIGTECGIKLIHPSVWAQSTLEKYTPDQNWIITDVRFFAELKELEHVEPNYLLIRVDRPTELRYPELWEEYLESDFTEFSEWEEFLKSKLLFNVVYHRSETELDSYPFKYKIEWKQPEELVDQVKRVLITETLMNETS